MPQQFTSVCLQNSSFLGLAEGEKHKEGIGVSFISVINLSKTQFIWKMFGREFLDLKPGTHIKGLIVSVRFLMVVFVSTSYKKPDQTVWRGRKRNLQNMEPLIMPRFISLIE